MLSKLNLPLYRPVLFSELAGHPLLTLTSAGSLNPDRSNSFLGRESQSQW